MLATALLKMRLVDLALQVLRLKDADARQVLQNLAEGELSLLTVSQGSCSICARQQLSASVSHASNISLRFFGKEGNSTGVRANVHLIQAAGSYVLLHAAATTGFSQREDPCCAQLDTREGVLASIQSLEVLMAGCQVATKAFPGICSFSLGFMRQAVMLTAKLCRRLASGRFSGTAAELFSRCLHRVEPYEPVSSSCYWRFWWQLAQLRAARHEWGEAQQICCAACKAISVALATAPLARLRRDAGYKQLLFSALLVKCKLWSRQLQPSGTDPSMPAPDLSPLYFSITPSSHVSL